MSRAGPFAHGDWWTEKSHPEGKRVPFRFEHGVVLVCCHGSGVIVTGAPCVDAAWGRRERGGDGSEADESALFVRRVSC